MRNSVASGIVIAVVGFVSTSALAADPRAIRPNSRQPH